MFRILVVDDDPAATHSLREAMKNLRTQPELHFVSDGIEALDFLHRRGVYAGVRLPNLILLDVNMPRLGGLETLYAIKTDPELFIIPVIMLSSSTSADDIRDSYRGRANCYVQKPLDLDRSRKFVQAIETFWIDFALLPGAHATVHAQRVSGSPIAQPIAEERNRASHHESPKENTERPHRRSGCEEHNRLLDQFGAAVRELVMLHEQQFEAIADTEFTRFDLLIHMANEEKQRAKYAYLRHVEAHGCSNHDDVKQART